MVGDAVSNRETEYWNFPEEYEVVPFLATH